MRTLLVVALCVSAVSHASAQRNERLAEAEAAYGDIDYERAGQLAQEALEGGELNPVEVLRAYELIGVTAAAGGDEARSRDAYIRMLALDRNAEADDNLAPRLRSPFLEARGFWAGRRERFGVDVEREGTRATVIVQDPIAMALTVVVRVGEQEQRGSAAEPLTVELPEEAALEVHVEDEYGNRIFERQGSALQIDPRQIQAPVETAEPESSGGVPVWVWIGVGVLAAGAIGVGIAFSVRTRPRTLQSGITFE